MTKGITRQGLIRILGSLLLWAAGVLAVIIFVYKWTDLNPPFPTFWFTSRNFHVVICIGLIVLSWLCHRHAGGRQDSRAAATLPAFQSMVLYGKPDCCLCDRASDLLAEYSHALPEVQKVDISGDEKLESLYAECVPVVEIDGRVRFRGIVSVRLLERLIEAKQRQHS